LNVDEDIYTYDEELLDNENNCMLTGVVPSSFE